MAYLQVDLETLVHVVYQLKSDQAALKQKGEVKAYRCYRHKDIHEIMIVSRWGP
jgi:hypothetical protein